MPRGRLLQDSQSKAPRPSPPRCQLTAPKIRLLCKRVLHKRILPHTNVASNATCRLPNGLGGPPRRPPTQIIFRQSVPQVRHLYSHDSTPFYGFIGPYAPYHSNHFSRRSHLYSFQRGPFVPHSHLSPSRHRHRGIFFPRGHHSRDSFLFGHGLALRYKEQPTETNQYGQASKMKSLHEKHAKNSR